MFKLFASRLQNDDPGAAGGGVPAGGAVAAFNDAQVQAINRIVAGVVNQTISARDKMSDKKRAEDAKAIRDDIAKMLDERLAKPADPDPAGDPGQGGGKGGKGGKGDDVRLQTLQRRFEELETKYGESERKASELLARSRASTLKQTTAEILNKHGIDGNKFRAAYALLQQDGRIRHRDSDSEEMVFVDDVGSEVEIEVGLASWAKSDDAKLFLPPSGVRGSGSRPAGSGPAPGTKPTKEQQFEIIGNSLRDAFSDSRL